TSAGNSPLRREPGPRVGPRASSTRAARLIQPHAATLVLTRLRHADPQLLAILGGRSAMIGSPFLVELRAEWSAEAKAEAIVRGLQARFGPVSPYPESAVRGIRDEERLNALLESAVRCSDLATVRASL